MPSPSMLVHLGFGDDPLTPHASTTWTDVSDQVEGSDRGDHYIQRGRNHERQEIEAGTAIVALHNTDRRFDPNNASSPYHDDLQPMTKIRIGAHWDGTDYWLFYGYVESWTPVYGDGLISTCTLECVDAFKAFAMIDVFTSGNRAQEGSGSRIDGILDAVSWPAADRAIAVGDIDVAEMQLDGNALRLIQQVAQAERGTFYMSRNGNATFEDRSFRDTATSIDIWGSAADGSELPYAGVSIRSDDSNIYNVIYATRIGGIRQAATDATSMAKYFVRYLHMSDLPWVDDSDALAAAQFMLARYSDFRPRLDRMVIDPGVRDSWPEVLDREISDMITVRRGTLYAGAVTEMDAHIESIEWHIRKGLWICTWQLSPHFVASPLLGTLNITDSWLIPTLQNSWVDYGIGRPPVSYRKDGNTVRLRGAVKNGTTAGSRIMTLPVGYRPPYNHVQIIYTGDPSPPVGTPDGKAAQVLIQPDGDVFAIAATTTSVDFSGVQFRVI